LDFQRLRRAGGALGFALAAMLAARPASAQFSTPYDPDFPSPPPAPAASTGPAAQNPPTASTSAAETPVEILVPAAAQRPTFLLIPRADPNSLLEIEASTEPAVSTAAAAGLSVERFLHVRDAVDRGEHPGEGGIQNPEEETVTETGAIAISTGAPKPPPPEIELPTYCTSLSVTGRKVIGVNYSLK